MTIEVVRHGVAAARDDWWGRPDRERPLSTVGRAQAEALGKELVEGHPLTGLWSSPATRCTETLMPLSAATGLEAIEEEALAEAVAVPVLDGGDAWVAAAWLGGRALGLVDRLVAAHPGERLVLCSHGDVIPALLAALAGRDGLAVADVRCAKGGRVSLTFSRGRCVAAAASDPPQV